MWRPGAAACSNQLKPRGEIYAGMPGCPMDPKGREYSWPGTRNWEVRRWGACAFSLGLLGSLLTCLHRPALCLRAHMGERGHPSSEKLFCLPSIKAPLHTRSSSPKRSRLAQPGQMPTSGPCSEGAGLGVGWARHCWEQAGHGKGVWTGQSPPGHLVGRKESPLSFFRSQLCQVCAD